MGEGEDTLLESLKIDGVSHVPNFNNNILSINKLANNLNYAITFFPDFFVMQRLVTKDLIGVGSFIGGLYRIGTLEMKALVTNFEVFHKRLGLPSPKKISNLNFVKTFLGIVKLKPVMLV